MRVDKYLWAIRVFKTRTLATAACKEGRIIIDDESVKPSREIKAGEEIIIRKGAVYFHWKVIDLPKSRVGAKLVEQFAKDITPEEELSKLEMIRLGNQQRPKGLGRPTKRDRRNWDEYFK